MQKNLLILSVIFSIHQMALHASFFVPKSSFFNIVTEKLLVSAPIPIHIEHHLNQTQKLDSQEALTAFQKIKKSSALKVCTLIDKTENSVYQNGELNGLLQGLKEKQTISYINKLLNKQYISALSNLGVSNPEEITTDSLRKEFSHFLVQKNDISPEYSCLIPLHIKEYFDKIVESIPEEYVTNICSITPHGTHPIEMPAATGARPEFNAYIIRLSKQQAKDDMLFGLTHEFGHALRLDVHRKQKVRQECYNKSFFKRLWNYKEIVPAMARVHRSCEFKADTHIITQLADTNPSLAIELCEHAIKSCTNYIALEDMQYFKTGEGAPTATFTSHEVEDHHPTWLARLLVLLRIYEDLIS